jgi:hypothetical protein
VSNPIPLHPADSLERVLDDMRQCVASRRDEGWVTRAVMVLIRHELLRVLDILIGLLADFRAGRLPPVIPAKCEPNLGVGGSPTVEGRCERGNERTNQTRSGPAAWAASPPRGAPSRQDNAPGDARATAPSPWPGQRTAKWATRRVAPAPRSPSPLRSPGRVSIPGPGGGPRGVASHASHVPRPRCRRDWGRDGRHPRTPSSLRYRIVLPCPGGAGRRRWPVKASCR